MSGSPHEKSQMTISWFDPPQPTIEQETIRQILIVFCAQSSCKFSRFTQNWFKSQAKSCISNFITEETLPPLSYQEIGWLLVQYCKKIGHMKHPVHFEMTLLLKIRFSLSYSVKLFRLPSNSRIMAMRIANEV